MGLGAGVDLIAFLNSRHLGMRAFGQIHGYLFAVFTAIIGFAARLVVASVLILLFDPDRYPAAGTRAPEPADRLEGAVI